MLKLISYYKNLRTITRLIMQPKIKEDLNNSYQPQSTKSKRKALQKGSPYQYTRSNKPITIKNRT